LRDDLVHLYPSPGVSPALDATLSRKGRGGSGDRAMSRPDTPFPKHWRYYIALKILLIASAVALALKLYDLW
jgi:hypothetical protein